MCVARAWGEGRACSRREYGTSSSKGSFGPAPSIHRASSMGLPAERRRPKRPKASSSSSRAVCERAWRGGGEGGGAEGRGEGRGAIGCVGRVA